MGEALRLESVNIINVNNMKKTTKSELSDRIDVKEEIILAWNFADTPVRIFSKAFSDVHADGHQLKSMSGGKPKPTFLDRINIIK